MASLLNMSGGSLLNKGLPYDAEIEYLKSTGTQWIETHYFPNNTTEIKIGIIRDFQQKDYIGARDNNWGGAGSNGIEIVAYDTNKLGFIFRHHSQNIYYIPVTQKKYYDIYLGKNSISVNEDTVYYNQTITYQSSLNSIILFGKRINPNSELVLSGVVIYYCKLYDNDTLILDLIPVRVGQVGYMYDKVSGQLFGNQGTGAFILGNDI